MSGEIGDLVGGPSGAQNLGGDADSAPKSDLFGEAETVLQEKRRRGRPKGALNRHTTDFEKWYYAQGMTDPLEKLGAFVTADPIGLWLWIRDQCRRERKLTEAPSLFSIIREQHACAKELAPYLHGKKPIQVEVTDERLPQLAIFLGTDQNTLAKSMQDAAVLGLGHALPDANEINDLEGAE